MESVRAEESSHLKMVIPMRVNFGMVLKMVKEFLPIQMEIFMMVSGKMTCNMVREHSLIKPVELILENGEMES